ncbi:hypothetical protein NHX12_026481 [Muraenolepis orangiensis]|uniref:Ribonuclease H1 n=1 Tax=Muraenolepis orangiensis TaxID=630683 RepID=A0A9Q0EKA5_9TELE|nr:hypothetical protein NHX12_026481 [Muraenolepis orangiensis]
MFTGVCGLVRRAVCTAGDHMGKVKFFYAVHKGVKPGVYTTWDECSSQVTAFPCAAYKKFASEKDAWAFVRGEKQAAVPTDSHASSSDASASLLPKRGPEPLYYIPIGQKRCYSDKEAESPSKRLKASVESSSLESSSSCSSEEGDGFTHMGDAVVVYTDGCCSRNGQKGARAGIGVYWGPNHPLNVADPLGGRQTNQRAEIQAACRALEQAHEHNIKKLVIYTDSKFTINGVTIWVKNWKANGWRLKSGGQVTNKDDFEKLDRLNGQLEVVWIHIPGHAGYTGNEEADRLSRQGAAKIL